MKTKCVKLLTDLYGFGLTDAFIESSQVMDDWTTLYILHVGGKVVYLSVDRFGNISYKLNGKFIRIVNEDEKSVNTFVEFCNSL